MENFGESSLLAELRYGFESLKRCFENDMRDTDFFVSKDTTRAYEAYLGGMADRTWRLLERI